MTEKQTEVVEMPEGIDFNAVLIGSGGRPVTETYFEDEDRERGERLEQKAALVGRLSPEEAEELLDLRKQRPRRIGQYCVDALYYQAQDDKKLDGTQKLKRGTLARKIAGSSEDPDEPYPSLPLTKKERKMVMEAGEKIWPPLIHTAVFVALEGVDALAEEAEEE